MQTRKTVKKESSQRSNASRGRLNESLDYLAGHLAAYVTLLRVCEANRTVSQQETTL